MNRNTERILFTTIGVLIVMFGYILGNFYSATQAQKDDFPTYENLLVTDTLVVGNPSKHHVEITAKDNTTTISINTAKKGLCGRILITADISQNGLEPNSNQ